MSRVIGSSLGGYFATWLAEKHGWPAVLLNPAVVPQRDLSAYLGEQPLWHGGGSITVEPHHLDELRALGVASITRPERYYLMAATGDEVLDYREMLAHYPGARTTLIKGATTRSANSPSTSTRCSRFATPKTSSRRRRAKRPESADDPAARPLRITRFMPPARAYRAADPLPRTRCRAAHAVTDS